MKILRPSYYGRGVTIAALGAATGSRVIDNAALHAMGYPEPPDKIAQLTGIHTRAHIDAARGESATSLAALACGRALEAAALRAADLGQLIISTSSPDQLIPTIGSSVQRLIGASGGAAHSISASCSGFLFGLDLATRALLTGEQSALVCGAEARSAQLDVADRSVGALFGDAAGAALLLPCEPGDGLLAIGITSQPAEHDAVVLGRGAADRLAMRDGARVYLEAIEGMKAAGDALLSHEGLAWGDLDLIIPHQANSRILKRLCWLAGVSEARAYSSIDRHGNTSSASIPLAMYDALADGALRAGALVMLLAVGAGAHAGAALLRVDPLLVERFSAARGPR